jgi:hypothetical protein
MTISLYQMTVPAFTQTLAATEKVLERGFGHAVDSGIDPESLVEARLCSDMLPLRFQILSVAHHSLGALEAVQSGTFAPPDGRKPFNYAGLQALVAETRAALAALSADAINASEDREVIFLSGERKVPFTAIGFLQSFSLPNFYFHATTAYDILRSRGVPLGKRDFLGRLQLKA